MSNHETRFELPANIEHYLETLSKLYGKEGNTLLQQTLVNAQVRVHDEWSYDGWDGGIYGHALYLVVPEALYLELVKDKEQAQDIIREDINKVHNVSDEFIEKVFLEMEVQEEHDWRKESGLLLTAKRTVPTESLSRIWGDGKEYRVFFSHKDAVKRETAKLKEELKVYGVSCFVAHEDIHPTKTWQDEIENALASMDVLVALMTEDFHDSQWTDQEVGFAFGRGVPIISVRLGKNPYGFIGKFQALSCSWDEAAKELVTLLIKYEGMLNAFVDAMERCNTYAWGNKLGEILPHIDNLSDPHAKALVGAFNENNQIRDSYGFNGKNPVRHGRGLAYHLKRWTGRDFRLSELGELDVV